MSINRTFTFWLKLFVARRTRRVPRAQRHYLRDHRAGQSGRWDTVPRFTSTEMPARRTCATIASRFGTRKLIIHCLPVLPKYYSKMIISGFWARKRTPPIPVTFSIAAPIYVVDAPPGSGIQGERRRLLNISLSEPMNSRLGFFRFLSLAFLRPGGNNADRASVSNRLSQMFPVMTGN